MSATALEDCRESFRYVLEQSAARIQQGDAEGTHYHAVEVSHRLLGSCELLGQADPAAFIEHLDRAGTARLRLLEHRARGGRCDAQLMAASKAVGFPAALASGNLALAAEIGRLLPRGRDPTWEYEDDFLFYDFLRHITLGLNGDATSWRPSAESALERWQAELRGRAVPGFDVCRAILDRSADAFAGGFDRYVERRVAQLEKHRASVAFDAKVFAAEGHVYIEGYAVLELAARVGLPIAREYPLLPSLGRAVRSQRHGASADWLLC